LKRRRDLEGPFKDGTAWENSSIDAFYIQFVTIYSTLVDELWVGDTDLKNSRETR